MEGKKGFKDLLRSGDRKGEREEQMDDERGR